MKYLVIDFGGTLVKYSVMDENCAILLKGEESAPTESRQQFINFLCGLYAKISGAMPIDGVAVSMPGVIDDENCYIRSAGAYMKLYQTDLREAIKDQIKVPFAVENDGKCGALGEVWKGNLKDCDDGIVLILGTGVGGGIVKNREIHKGKSLSAGEFSDVILGDQASPRNTVASRCGVAALLFEAMRLKGIDIRKSPHYNSFSRVFPCEQELSELNNHPAYAHGLNGYQFFDLLNQNDPVIVKLYQDYIYHIALFIFNLHLIYAPEKFLIGGGISRQSRLIPDIRAQYQEIFDNASLIRLTPPCIVDACALGNEANQYGALYHFLKKYHI